VFPATAVPTTPVPMCAPNSRPSSASLGRSSAGWYVFFFPHWGWWSVACALKISCFTKGKFCNVNERVDQSTWLRSRRSVLVAATWWSSSTARVGRFSSS
jgi:hypothetical protein